MQTRSEQKPFIQTASPAGSSSYIESSNAKSVPSINEPSIENKRKSPRGRNAVRFGNLQKSPERNEDLDMFSESVCALSGSERGCYTIEDVV